MKILLVEDDACITESIRICFRIYLPQAQIISSEGGLDAMELLKTQDLDGVILDLGLPDIDGLEVLKRLREFSKLPVIVASARNSPETIARARELGANDYIVKPYSFQNLLSALNKFICRQQLVETSYK